MLGRRTRARDPALMVADSELSEALGQHVRNPASLLPPLTQCLSHQPKRSVVPSHMDVTLVGPCKQTGHSSNCLPSNLEALTGSLPSLRSSHLKRALKKEGRGFTFMMSSVNFPSSSSSVAAVDGEQQRGWLRSVSQAHPAVPAPPSPPTPSHMRTHTLASQWISAFHKDSRTEHCPCDSAS